MTTKKAYSLKKGSSVVHKRYGQSLVVDVIPEFGPVIIPSTIIGRMKLESDSGLPGCPVNELWRYGVPYIASDYKQNLK